MILAGATLLGGVIQGRMSRRWGRSQEFQVLADRLQELPTEIGPWHMRASPPLAPAAEAVLECAGYVSRQYENRKTGEIVTVAVLLGPAGPISVHTPDVCYSSQEFTVIGSPEADPVRRRRRLARRTVEHVSPVDESDGRQLARLLRLVHRRPVVGAGGRPFRVCRPAASLQDSSGRTIAVAGRRKASDQCRIFLKEFLPAVRPYLVKPVKE